jgi:hypothetical protein
MNFNANYLGDGNIHFIIRKTIVDDVGFLSIILDLLGIDPPALFGSLFNDVRDDAGLGPAELTDDLGLGLGDINGVDGLEGD